MAARLHCETVGAGPDLVLLHGWGLHGGIWAPLVPTLSDSFRLHLFDLPGHGHSAMVLPYDLDTLCDALADAVPAQAQWLGWSLGGLLALAFAARHPQRVSRLALLACNPRFVAQDDDYPGMQTDVLESFTADLVADHRGTVRRFLGLVARGAPDNQVLRELRRSVDSVPAPRVDALQGGLTLLRETDAIIALGDLRMPCCLLGGVRDSLVPIAALQQLHARYPQLTLREIEGAGHAPFISHPDRTATLLKEFYA